MYPGIPAEILGADLEKNPPVKSIEEPGVDEINP